VACVGGGGGSRQGGGWEQADPLFSLVRCSCARPIAIDADVIIEGLNSVSLLLGVLLRACAPDISSSSFHVVILFYPVAIRFYQRNTQMQPTVPNHARHLHCTRCFRGSACTTPGCRQQRTHPGQQCSHGFLILEGGPDCPVHCSWEKIKKLLVGRGWDRRNAECMSNVLLNRIVGLSQHADMPPSSPLETLESVLEHVGESQECKEALSAAKAFIVQQRAGAEPSLQALQAVPDICEHSSAAPQPAALIPAAAGCNSPHRSPMGRVHSQDDWPALSRAALASSSRKTASAAP
jgi:hypothetical protein